MITLRRAAERRHAQFGKSQVWLTFNPADGSGTPADGVAPLATLTEAYLAPGKAVAPDQSGGVDTITYVREGILTDEDSPGVTRRIHASEFQRSVTCEGIQHRVKNASRTQSARIFQIRLRAAATPLETEHTQKRFSMAERRGGLCIVASPDARRGSLRISQDVLIYSAILYPGQHIAYELPGRRSAWIHMIQGEALLGDDVLSTGDGAGLSDELAVSLTPREESEILLFDMPMHSQARVIS